MILPWVCLSRKSGLRNGRRITGSMCQESRDMSAGRRLLRRRTKGGTRDSAIPCVFRGRLCSWIMCGLCWKAVRTGWRKRSGCVRNLTGRIFMGSCWRQSGKWWSVCCVCAAAWRKMPDLWMLPITTVSVPLLRRWFLADCHPSGTLLSRRQSVRRRKRSGTAWRRRSPNWGHSSSAGRQGRCAGRWRPARLLWPRLWIWRLLLRRLLTGPSGKKIFLTLTISSILPCRRFCAGRETAMCPRRLRSLTEAGSMKLW